MKRNIAALVCIAFLLVGCSANSGNQASYGSSKIFNVETSHFDGHTAEQIDTAYVVKGRVNQENDGNAVAIKIHTEEDTAISIKGTLTKKSGNDTELTYRSSDGETVEIADNAAETFDTVIDILKGDGEVAFIGESAVYDFEIQFELVDGVSYSSL